MTCFTLDECLLSTSVNGEQDSCVAMYDYQAYSAQLLDHVGFSMKDTKAVSMWWMFMYLDRVSLLTVSIHPENSLLKSTHCQGLPPMPSPSWSLWLNCLPVPLPLLFSQLPLHLLLVCCLLVCLIKDNGHLSTFLTRGLPREQETHFLHLLIPLCNTALHTAGFFVPVYEVNQSMHNWNLRRVFVYCNICTQVLLRNLGAI